MQQELSICGLLCNDETTRAGSLEKFFKNLSRLETALDVKTERIFLVDDKTTDRTMEIARSYCNPEYFHFQDYSQARNLLIERANGNWIFMPEPDMRYNSSDVTSAFTTAQKSDDKKCIETWQKYYHPDGNTAYNFYYLFIRNNPKVRFQGLVFETLRGVFPHEFLRVETCVVANHYVKDFSERMENARPLFEKELEQLEEAEKTNDPEELYWTSMRYDELSLMDCLPMEDADKTMVSLLKKAIDLKPDFGPAYFELAKQHIYMERFQKAKKTAQTGYDKGYEFCQRILQSFA